MNRRNILLTLSALGSLTATGPAQVTPPAPIQVNSPIITINSSPGDQTDPHVDKDLASYTDTPSNQIRYYRFSTGADLGIPQDSTTLFDVLSDVNGGRIAFTRVELDRNAIFVFDPATESLTEIDPLAGSNRLGVALGGNTLAFVDLASGQGDMFAYDLGANPPQPPQVVSLDPNAEQNPNVSPDGNMIVWEDCPVSIVNCDIFKGRRAAGVWSVSAVAHASDPEDNPDTDGTWIVYDANRAGNATGEDIYYQLATGGPEFQLALPGAQQNPSIKGGLIAFESRASSSAPSDLFVYDIANNILYQVTATPTIDENLNDLSLLDNGDIRMVWAANDGVAGDENIHATTFTPIRPVLYQICPLYDSNAAKKTGSAYPIKIQLCDASGTNLSSSSITLHAVSVTRISTNTPTVLDDTGNANPDFDFRYDSSLEGYVFNLSTKGYATGTYSLNFIAGPDLVLHSALFAVK
jgi:hypothetical protein